VTKVSDGITIRNHYLKNRMTMAPTVKFDWAGPDGKLSDNHIKHYMERAEHGIGLLCVEATAVSPDGRFDEHHIGLWDDSQIENHKKVTEACRKNGVVSLIQLNHTGNSTNPAVGRSIGPSSVPCRTGVSQEMSVAEIKRMQQNFIDAAARAQAAGYDGIQLHGCHGYLINQFVCKKTNLRTDEYGGSTENMARFASEIISGIRERCGDDFIISVRTIGADPDIESAAAIAEKYVEAGCDYLQVSSGIGPAEDSLKSDCEYYNDICNLGIRFHDIFKGRVPVSCVNGLFEPEQVKYIIENDLCDTVDLARAMLADPEFPLAVLEGREYVKCFQCPRCQYGPFTKHMCPAQIKRDSERG